MALPCMRPSAAIAAPGCEIDCQCERETARRRCYAELYDMEVAYQVDLRRAQDERLEMNADEGNVERAPSRRRRVAPVGLGRLRVSAEGGFLWTLSLSTAATILT